jgi:hypothetical protein
MIAPWPGDAPGSPPLHCSCMYTPVSGLPPWPRMSSLVGRQLGQRPPCLAGGLGAARGVQSWARLCCGAPRKSSW